MNHKEWAKKALAFLVHHVANYRGGQEKYLTYKQLAEGIGYPGLHQGSGFGRNIGRTLGEIGEMLQDVVVDGERSPYIQALVVNSQTKLPGSGIDSFYPGYADLPKDKQKDLMKAEYERIFEFGDRWFKVLDQLGISEALPEARTKSTLHNPFGGEGSPEHRALRDYIYEHPELIVRGPVLRKHKEYPLKSGDFIDVYLETPTEVVGVEVKSLRSGPDDLERGLFQCIKYHAVLEAEAKVHKKTDSSKRISCVLVTEGRLNNSLQQMRKKLGIEVFEGFILAHEA